MRNYHANSIRYAYAALDNAIPRDLRELSEVERRRFKALLESWLRELAIEERRHQTPATSRV